MFDRVPEIFNTLKKIGGRQMEITKAASVLFNGALPIAGFIAGQAVVNINSQMNPVTGIPLIAGAILFGAITGFGPGERSHRYFGGSVAQAVPLAMGITASGRGFNNEFHLGSFFVATAVSITAQVFLRELRHLPEAMRNQESGGSFSPAPSSRALITSGPSATDNNGSSASSASTDIVEYGKASNISLLPAWDLGSGQELQSLGKVVTRVTYEEAEEKDLLRGDRSRQRRTMETSDGGKHTEESMTFTGWFSSKRYQKKDYDAQGSSVGGSAPSSTDGPTIDEVL